MASVKIPAQKVILCGEYGAGKSSIFRRFTNNTFVTATDRKATLGLDNYEKTYKGENGREINVSVRYFNHHVYPPLNTFIPFSYNSGTLAEWSGWPR